MRFAANLCAPTAVRECTPQQRGIGEVVCEAVLEVSEGVFGQQEAQLPLTRPYT